MANRRILWAGAVTLPSPTKITVNDEIIWSSNTGRSANGTMIGDVIASKKNISLSWGVLTEAELALIKNSITPGFFDLSFRADGLDMTIRAYRGSLAAEAIGWMGDGNYYYRSATATVIQK